MLYKLIREKRTWMTKSDINFWSARRKCEF